MLSLIKRKSCKRCGGDLSIECDIYGVFIECIQCGATYTKDDLKLTAVNNEGNTLKATPSTVSAAAVSAAAASAASSRDAVK
jgi:hypothetical protein